MAIYAVKAEHKKEHGDVVVFITVRLDNEGFGTPKAYHLDIPSEVLSDEPGKTGVSARETAREAERYLIEAVRAAYLAVSR